MKEHRTETLIHLIRSSSHFLKQVTKLLVPFSVLSVALGYSFLCNVHILAHGLQLFSFNVGKNYMFLLCNGLLVFIATSSGLIGSYPVETDDFKAGKTLTKSKGRNQRELQVESSDEQEGSIVVKKKFIPDFDVHVDVQDEGDQQLVTDEEDREEEGHGLMNNEELNKKCEDFIRKMKESIRFEY